MFMSDQKVSDNFDEIDFGSLTGSGVNYADVQAFADHVRSERLPDVQWSKTTGCFRIQYQECVVIVCGSAKTAWKIINMVILDMI
jgi:hypothetical protein